MQNCDTTRGQRWQQRKKRHDRQKWSACWNKETQRESWSSEQLRPAGRLASATFGQKMREAWMNCSCGKKQADRWTAERMEDGRLCMLSVWHYILYAWLCLTWIYGHLLIFTRSYKPLNKHMREQNFVKKLQKAEIKGYTMLLAHYQNRPILALKLNIGYQPACWYPLI